MRSLGTSILSLALAVALFPAQLGAQVGEGKEMHLTLSESIEIALANNSTILQQKYSVALADAQVDGARNSFLPSLRSGWSMSRDVRGPREGQYLDPSTNLIVTSLGESTTGGSQRVSANMDLSVFNASNLATLSSRKHGLKSSEMSLAASRNSIVFQVKQRYFQLLQAIKLLEVQQEQVRVSEETLRRNATLYEIGSAPISDELTARSSLESVRVTLITRENNVAITGSNLGFTLGLPPDIRILPVEVEYQVKQLPITFEKALERALGTEQSLQARKFAMLADKDALKSTIFSIRYPTVSMSASYGWTLTKDEDFQGIEDLFMKNYSYGVNLSVSLPIFNRLNTTNSIKTQRLRYLQSQELLDQAKRQKALNIKQAFLNIEQSRRSIEANEAAVRASEEEFKLQDQRYNFGAGTFLERQNAQLGLYQARNSLVQAQYNYQIQVALLETEIGGPIEPQE
jgi:outer membrane protein